jgi:hypothetical protein
MHQEKISKLKSDILDSYGKYKAKSPEILKKIEENDEYLFFFTFLLWLEIQ